MKTKELRHSIVIVEQCDTIDKDGNYNGTTELSIWEDSQFRFLPAKSFLRYLEARYPKLDWWFDDGTDWEEDKNTKFCQFVHYTGTERNHCVLASYYLNEEG